MADSNIKTLIKQIQRGDEFAFRTLYDLYKQRVFSVCYAILRDAHMAEEAVQDTFVKLYKKIAKFDATKSFNSWLNKIAANSALDITRRVKRAKEVSVPDETTLDSVQYSNELERDAYDKIWQTLDKIPPDYRIVLILRDIHGFSGEEAGEILGIRHDTLRWKLHKARGMFRQIWEQTRENFPS